LPETCKNDPYYKREVAAKEVLKHIGIKIIEQDQCHLGAVIGTESLKDGFIENKVDGWVQDFRLFCTYAADDHQAACSAPNGICSISVVPIAWVATQTRVKNGSCRVDLLPFTTAHPCEQGFLELMVIKTKAPNPLDPGHDLHIALSKIEPCVGEWRQHECETSVSPITLK